MSHTVEVLSQSLNDLLGDRQQFQLFLSTQNGFQTEPLRSFQRVAVLFKLPW